jgi:hypothetical protein
MKITALMSKNSEVFLDLVLSENFDIASAGWEAMINHFRESNDIRKKYIAADVTAFRKIHILTLLDYAHFH